MVTKEVQRKQNKLQQSQTYLAEADKYYNWYLLEIKQYIAIVEVISIVEESSPRRLLVEALLSIDELTYAEERYNKRTSAKTKHLPAFKT